MFFCPEQTHLVVKEAPIADTGRYDRLRSTEIDPAWDRRGTQGGRSLEWADWPGSSPGA